VAHLLSQRVSDSVLFHDQLYDEWVLTVLTGAFILASTTARSSSGLLGWNCGYSFTSNIMYGVLYALSPEVFPTRARGTGNALVASANRIFGVMVRRQILLSSKVCRVTVYRLLLSRSIQTWPRQSRYILLAYCFLLPASSRCGCPSNQEVGHRCDLACFFFSWLSGVRKPFFNKTRRSGFHNP
jgi:hypothetical protein